MNKSETEAVLKNVLFKTYVPDEEELQFQERALVRLRTTEGRDGFQSELRKLRDNPNANRDNIDGILGDWEGYLRTAEEAVKKGRTNFEEGKRLYEGFMRDHHDVIDYIAGLMSEDETVAQTPSEEFVSDVLTRLSGNCLTGELGFGAEHVGMGMFLDMSVRQSAYAHARRTGKNPETYWNGLQANKSPGLMTY